MSSNKWTKEEEHILVMLSDIGNTPETKLLPWDLIATCMNTLFLRSVRRSGNACRKKYYSVIDKELIKNFNDKVNYLNV